MSAHKNEMQKFTELTVDSILKRVVEIQATGELVLPANYIAENAVRAAWLLLPNVVNKDKKPALEVCTKNSIANAFLQMVTSGLSVAKNQGYFVVYGDKLQFDPSYIGSITQAKRNANVKEVNAVTVYKNDVFEYGIDFTTGRKKIFKHEQQLANINKDQIVGAYAVVTYNDGSFDTEIMTIDQIKTSWNMGGSNGNSPAHKNFPDQMCEKTVIGRALKIESQSSDDEGILKNKVLEDHNHEISQNANKTALDFDEAEIIDPLQLPEAKENNIPAPTAAAPQTAGTGKIPVMNTTENAASDTPDF